MPSFSRTLLVEEQAKCSPEELSVWSEHGALCAPDGLWQAPDGRPAMPMNLSHSIMVQAHNISHVSSKQMMKTLQYWWHPFLTAMVSNLVLSCKICQEHNVKPSLKQLQGTFSPLRGPGEEIVIDFTDMVERVQGKRYLLVIVDHFTGWPEAFPTSKEDSCQMSH